MTELEQLLKRDSAFYDASHIEKIKVFGWYLQHIEQNSRFSGGDLLRCYDQAGLKRPANISKQLEDMCRKVPPELLRDRGGYQLERKVRHELDVLYRDRDITVQVSGLITELPASIPNINERNYLSETLICYKNGAFRASIVMMWNLAYAHFCDWLFAKHLGAFNVQWPIRFAEQYKKSKVKSIADIEHFSELKESEVIEISRSAGLISQGVHKSLTEKLGKRNSAAHPSSLVFSQLQTEECIHDLVVNVMMRML